MTLDRSRTVTVGRTRIATVVRPGDAGGVPLLLCNGIGAASSSLKPFVDSLDAGLTAIRFDAPGVGASPLPPVPLPYPVIARIAAGVVQQLGHGSFDVLGISWGGALAQQIAFQYPRRCRRLVLVATATGTLMVPASPDVLRHMVTPARHRDPAYARAVAGYLYGGTMRNRPGLAADALTGGHRPPSDRGYLYQLLAGVGWTSLPFLKLIRQRTLILAGTDDPIVPFVNARMMTSLLPHAELHSYDDGHLALLTRAPELGRAVSDFLLSD